jgi:hypothetical protein
MRQQRLLPLKNFFSVTILAHKAVLNCALTIRLPLLTTAPAAAAAATLAAAPFLLLGAHWATSGPLPYMDMNGT